MFSAPFPARSSDYGGEQCTPKKKSLRGLPNPTAAPCQWRTSISPEPPMCKFVPTPSPSPQGFFGDQCNGNGNG